MAPAPNQALAGNRFAMPRCLQKHQFVIAHEMKSFSRVEPRRREWARAAFTLIELLAVIAIVSVLMTLIVVGLKSTRERANGVACMSNLRQIGVALALYAGDNNGKYPGPSWAAVISSTGEVTAGSGIFVTFLDPYTQNNDKLWDCPSRPELRKKGFTGYMQGAVQGQPVFGYVNPKYEPLTSIQILSIEPDPSKRWMLEDLDAWNVPNPVYNDIAPYPAHNLGRNVLYLDGHVQWVQSQQGVRP